MRKFSKYLILFFLYLHLLQNYYNFLQKTLIILNKKNISQGKYLFFYTDSHRTGLITGKGHWLPTESNLLFKNTDETATSSTKQLSILIHNDHSQENEKRKIHNGLFFGYNPFLLPCKNPRYPEFRMKQWRDNALSNISGY